MDDGIRPSVDGAIGGTVNIDIVIPAYNSVDLTWRCIQHVCLFPPGEFYPFEPDRSCRITPETPRIILVDNASIDDTPLLGEWLKARGHTYVRNEKNLGPYAAWNQGWRAARPDNRVVFLNNDVSVMPGCLTALCESPFAYTCVSEVIGAYRAPELLAYTDGIIKQRGQEPRYREGYLHSCFAVDRDVLEMLGGFDEHFFLTYGDTDFLIRAKEVGVTARVDTKAIVHHGVSMTRRREFGTAHDATLDHADHRVFEVKYVNRPDILAEHPWPGIARSHEDRRVSWAEGEEI